MLSDWSIRGKPISVNEIRIKRKKEKEMWDSNKKKRIIKKIAMKISRHEKFLVSLEIMDHPFLRLLSDRSIDIILLKGCVVHWAMRCNGSAEARKYKLYRHYPPYSEIVGICDVYFRINVAQVVICLYCCTYQENIYSFKWNDRYEKRCEWILK